MNKCDINAQSLKQIQTKVVQTLMGFRVRKESISTLKQNIVTLLNEIAENYNLAGIAEITSTIYNLAQRFGVVDPSAGFFSIENLTNLLTESQQGIQRTNTFTTSTEQITDVQQARTRLEANKDFLENAYGLARDIRTYVENYTNQNIFDCCIINRGSIISDNIGIIKTNCELNQNLRRYQQVLFQRIVDYLNYIISTSPNLGVSDRVKTLLENPRLYNDNNEYTGILEDSEIKNLIQSFASPSMFSSNTEKVDTLRQLYNISKDNTKSQQERTEAKRRLDAYNANVILTHFDTYLSLVLGKAIDIKDFNVKTGEDKYQISAQTSSLATTWRTSDNIDPASEADAITKLAITTTPLHKWQIDTPVEGQYLQFSDFEHIIAKVKDLSYRVDVMTTTFDDTFLDNSPLSPETKQFLKGKTLSEAINSIRRNPRQYLSYIFELLTDEQFYNLHKDTFLNSKVFTDDELNKLYTIARGIFNPNPQISSSLYNLSGQDFDTDYYSYITQTVDSIFKVSYIQYYRDQDGNIQIRTLIDQSINNIRRNIEQTINTNNSINLIKDYDTYKDELNLKPNDGEDFYFIEFDLPISSQKIKAKVIAASGDVIFTNTTTGSPITNFEQLWNDNEVKLYIDTVLRIGISQDINFVGALRNQQRSYSEMCKNLLSFVARVHLNQYVSYNILKDLSNADKESKIKAIYGKNAPRYNYQLDELGLVHGTDIPLLKSIALAKANTTGVTTASQAKDGEGNGQSLQTLSRLLGSFQSQWDLQERQPWSATNESILLTIPGLYEGVFTSKEYYSQDGKTKSFVDMSVDEMDYASLVYDFIGGIMPKKDSQIVGNGHVMFLPSVNSDKGTIGRIKINLNKEVTINGVTKTIAKLNSAELETLIAQEFGTIYTKMYKAITADWAILDAFIASKGIQAPNLSHEYLHGLAGFNIWWATKGSHTETIKDAEGNSKEIRVGNTYGEKSPVDFIRKITLEYNRTNRLQPLEIIDQVHYKNKDGNLGINDAFIAQIARFNPQFLRDLDPNFNLEAYPSSGQFWEIKKTEVLKGLIKSNFRINTTTSTQEELVYIRRTYPSWVNKSGDVVLAKFHSDEQKPVNITSKRDLIRLAEEYDIDSTDVNTIIDKLKTSVSGFELNPFIEQYNYLDYLFTQEFMCSTVGSFIAHPEKSKDWTEEEIAQNGRAEYSWERVLRKEASHFQAQHKRNVSFTAAMHAFQLNLLNGIPEEYNIAVIEDITDEQGTILGLNNNIKAFDGATFVNPFIVILENNSLGGASAGITKKQFVHFKNERTGTGGIIKTAGFGLTNDLIRNSPFLERMMRKMTNHKWLNKDGSIANIDITHDYKGNKIKYKDIYFTKNGVVYQMDGNIEVITLIDPNTNQRYYRFMPKIYKLTQDINGKADGTIDRQLSNEDVIRLFNGILEFSDGGFKIETNYQLWNFFGGKNSITFKNGNKFLEPSNTSVENVVQAMNNIGTVIGNPSKIETQDQLWQPLKHVDVHYVPTAGAVKQGAANINSVDKYNNDEDYDIQKIKMYQSGIQLDKEHHADESELSLMTQVMSACAAKGYTLDAAIGLYEALRKATEIGIREHLEPVREVFKANTNTSEALQEVLMKSIINSLSTSNSDNFAKTIASDLIKQAREGKEIKFAEAMLPLSDNTVYAKVLSIITSYLTKTGIKAKIPGILAVISPSHSIFKIYAGRKYESFTNPEQELATLQAQQPPVYDGTDPESISNLELDREYFITRVATVDPIDFSTPNISGVSLEQAFREVIYRRIYNSQFVTPQIKALITRIIKGNSNKSLREVVDIVVSQAPEQDQQALRAELMRLINLPISNDMLFTDDKTELGYLIEVLGNYLSSENLQSFIYGKREDLFNALKRYNLQDLTDPAIQGAHNYIARANITIATPVTDPVSELIRTPSEYRKLKQDIRDGKVLRVVENIIAGRDLAAYNVRFSTIDGHRYQLWDLDSAYALFEYNDIKKRYKKNKSVQIAQLTALFQRIFPNQPVTLDNMEILIRRWLQRDLMNLSNSTPPLNRQYKQLLDSNDGTQEWYDRFAKWVNIYLGTGNGSQLEINGQRLYVNAGNFNSIDQEVRKIFSDITKVKVNGNLVSVDRSSIVTQPYELISSKRFATKFGLKEFDSLEEIKNDQDFFIKQYLRKYATQVEENQYSVELKRSNGNHYYLLSRDQLIGSGLTKTPDSLIKKVTIDGKQYRLDSQDNIMYELLPGTEIYTDNLRPAHEVIVTNDLNAYIKNLHFDTIKLSNSLRDRPSIINSLLSTFKESRKKQVRWFYRYITSYGNGTNNILKLNQEYHNINLNNYQDYITTDPVTKQRTSTNSIIRQGWSKHTSFLKSLDIVAARIPAQHMQSFMPMRLVAFDNPDLNNTYVSTLQLLLQGSDMDIDAVSLAMFDIDDNGILQLWSPYANIESEELLNASIRLPIPSGVETQFNETDNFEEAADFLDKYKSIFSINRVRVFDKESKSYNISESEVSIDILLDTPEKINLFTQFLTEVPVLRMPSIQFYEKFASDLNNRELATGITANLVPSIFEEIKRIADYHNLYFDNLFQDDLSTVVNNYTMQSMFDVINDPVNLIAAHTSVDGTTDPLKDIANTSSEAKEASARTPGNFNNKFEGVVENQVGKKGIAICATGLKAFFGLTQYCNITLNSGTATEQQRILLGSDHKGIMIGGKIYHTLANIRTKDINSIQSEEVLDALSSTTNDYDQALILSALLSLATDNAKELALSKLNASTKTLGLYVYGISIGMDFKDIAKIMMSDVGRVINEVANDNVFSEKDGYGSVDENLFKYFENGPTRVLSKFEVYRDSQGQVIDSPLEALKRLVTEDSDFRTLDGQVKPLNNALAEYAQSNLSLSEKLQFFEKMRGRYYSSSAEAKELFNQLIDFVQDYIQQGHIIGQNKNIYEDIKTLAGGAAEMRILGQLFGLNKGLKTSADELSKQINNITRAIYDHTKKLEDIIDLTKFAFDENYRNKCILRYEEIKHSFNILDAVAKVPHFMGYLQTLAVAAKEADNSFKFRSSRNLSLQVSINLNYSKEDKIIRGIQNFIGDYLRKGWMRSNELTFIIPKGNRAFTQNGDMFDITEDTPIRLGTDWGDATFRMWMENEVIPNLKKGIIKPGTKTTSVSSNKFIQDLGNDLLTTTTSHNPSTIYTLPINMLPRTDQERVIFNQYKSEFNKLAGSVDIGGLGYQYELTTYDQNGNAIKSLSKPIALVDLFTYYAMIADSWKLGEKSLVPILEDFQDQGIIKDFHDYVTDIDKSGFTLSIDNINFEKDLLPYVAPFESPYSSFTEYIQYRNPNTRKYQLMRKLSSGDQAYTSVMDQDLDDFLDSSKIKNYEFMYSQENTNYFNRNIESPIIERTLNVEVDGKKYECYISYAKEDGKLLSLNVDAKKLTLADFPGVEYIPTHKVNKRKQLDLSTLQSIIRNKLNSCD